jgi:hypothetical protein
MKTYLLVLNRNAATEYLSGFPFLSLVDFLQWRRLIGCRKNLLRDERYIVLVQCTFHGRFSKQFSESQPGYGSSVWVTWVTCGFQNAATSSVKRISEMIVKISKCFHRTKHHLCILFNNRDTKKLKNHKQTNRKC